jgi:hypothetical protein
MLSLNGHRGDMSLMCHSLFLRRWTRSDPTIATVIADPVHRGVVDHRGVVNIVNVGDVHVVHRTVVVKLSALPTSALIALTKVSVAVTDSSVETYLLTPVAIIEDISAAAPTPIGWSPEQTGFRSQHPCTRYPVVVILGVSPVPRGPEITVGGTKGLLVYGQFRRGE